MQGLGVGEEQRIRCPGCGRVIDTSDLRPNARFKCTKCKKMLRFGPHLLDPQYAANWQTLRIVLLVGCIAPTIWCVTVGYDFGLRTGQWVSGFGGALAVWLVVAGCIALAARTTQNNGVMAGVTVLMLGVAVLFVDRLGRYVGYDVASWREYRFFEWWAPSLVVLGALVLAVALVVQARTRAL